MRMLIARSTETGCAMSMRERSGYLGSFDAMAKRDLTPDENERVKELLRALLRRYDDNQSSLAPLLKIGQPALSGILSGRQGTSWRTAVHAASLAGRDVLEVLTGKATSIVVDESDPYPNRQRAAAAARILGISAQAIDAVCSMSLKQDTPDTAPVEWLDDIRQAEKQLARGLDPFPGARVVDLEEAKKKRTGSPKKGRKGT